jgi:3-hydroxybutyryl-CoA dehydrogenase
MEETRIAVVGAGTIGLDVALDLALHGCRVVLKDVSGDVLERAMTAIEGRYRLAKLMGGGSTLPPLEPARGRIEATAEYDRFGDVTFVIENITEDYEAKRAVYAELREVCEDTTVYGVNTSCIPITRIASLMPRPDNVIGTHFMNPVPVSKLVEVVKGRHTSEATVARTKRLVKDLGKTAVVTSDSPGFVTNRVMMLTVNEAIWVLHDEVADAKSVDTIFRLGFGHKMGPLATADLIGLDTILNSLLVLQDAYGDPKFRPCPLLQQMVAAGNLGRKTGRGFFTY